MTEGSSRFGVWCVSAALFAGPQPGYAALLFHAAGVGAWRAP